MTRRIGFKTVRQALIERRDDLEKRRDAAEGEERERLDAEIVLANQAITARIKYEERGKLPLFNDDDRLQKPKGRKIN